MEREVVQELRTSIAIRLRIILGRQPKIICQEIPDDGHDVRRTTLDLTLYTLFFAERIRF